MSEPQDTISQGTSKQPAYVPPPPPLPNLSTTPPRRHPILRDNEDAFIKRYQTEVAASASSCLSTFLAVRWPIQETESADCALTQHGDSFP